MANIIYDQITESISGLAGISVKYCRLLIASYRCAHNAGFIKSVLNLNVNRKSSNTDQSKREKNVGRSFFSAGRRLRANSRPQKGNNLWNKGK